MVFAVIFEAPITNLNLLARSFNSLPYIRQLRRLPLDRRHTPFQATLTPVVFPRTETKERMIATTAQCTVVDLKVVRETLVVQYSLSVNTRLQNLLNLSSELPANWIE